MLVTIYTYDGTKYSENIEEFDLQAFIDDINTDTHKMIKFGKIGITKNSIRLVDTNPELA